MLKNGLDAEPVRSASFIGQEEHIVRMLKPLLWSLLAALLVCMPYASAEPRAGWPENVRIGTASLGGTYVVYGDGLAHRIMDELGVVAVSEHTGGPYHNFALVQLGLLELGMTTLGPAVESWNGLSPVAPGERMQDVRALFPMYRTPFQVVALARSGIERIADLNGKRVGVGPIGGTCAGYWPRFLEALGVEDVQIAYANANELATHLRHGFIDAFAFCAGIPIRAFAEIGRRQEINLFAFDEQEQAVLLGQFDLEPFVIPAGAYEGQTTDQASVAFWNFGIAHKDLPEDLVYELMKLALDDPEKMEAIHPSAREMRAENLLHNQTVWFHPGAVRYYRERDLEVPEHLLPPELREEVAPMPEPAEKADESGDAGRTTE